jgi:ankyrin repeat protein
MPHAAFFEAIRRDDATAVASLVDREPKLLEARDERGRSGFGVALIAGSARAAELLRARGYLPDVAECAWITDWPRFDQIADPARADEEHPLGGSTMWAAARGGAGAAIWRVYAQGATPNPVTRRADAPSPLRAAFEHPDLGVAEITAATLLSNGADPSAREPGGSSALHAAAARGARELVAMLVRKGADPDRRDDRGRAPIELADRAGHRDVVTLLETHRRLPRDFNVLRRAVDLDHRPYRPADLSDVDVMTQAAFTGLGHARFDELRRAHQRDPRLVHAHATTTEMAVDAAGHTGRADICMWLLEQGAPYSIVSAIMCNRPRDVERLLDEEPRRLRERGPHDFPALWYPIIGKAPLDMMELLLDRGAVIEEQDFLGTTALHWAAMGGSIDVVALLLSRGADPRRVGRKFEARGETPLEMAVAGGHHAVARLLEEHGRRRS